MIIVIRLGLPRVSEDILKEAVVSLDGPLEEHAR